MSLAVPGVVACSLLAVVACSADDGPGALGESCAVETGCVDGLSCDDGRCLGDFIVRGQVFFPMQTPPQEALGLLLFYAGDAGAGDPLVPELAALGRVYVAPVTYPVSFQLSGVPAGDFEVIAYVAQPEQRALRGQVNLTVAADGALAVNDQPSETVALQITGESALEE